MTENDFTAQLTDFRGKLEGKLDRVSELRERIEVSLADRIAEITRIEEAMERLRSAAGRAGELNAAIVEAREEIESLVANHDNSSDECSDRIVESVEKAFDEASEDVEEQAEAIFATAGQAMSKIDERVVECQDETNGRVDGLLGAVDQTIEGFTSAADEAVEPMRESLATLESTTKDGVGRITDFSDQINSRLEAVFQIVEDVRPVLSALRSA